MKYALALCAVSVFAVGCSGDDEMPGKPLTLGAIVDQTGNNSELSWLTAVEFATNQWNEALVAEGITSFHFRNSVQNSENDVAGGENSRAIARIREAVLDGAKAASIDTTQIAEEVNKPKNMNQFLIPMQCSSCTGGSFLSPTSAAVAGDDQLTASRRNSDFWMSRTIMSTGLQAQVVSQLIRASARGCPTCLPGDINGDGFLKVVNFGSNEAFGSATTTAVATELLKLYTPEQRRLIHFERFLHDNKTDPRDIDFVGAVTRLTNATNEDLPPADGTTASVNAHLFATDPGVSPNDGAPDFITVATFGRNDVAYITEIRNRGIAGYGSGPESTMRSLHFQTFRFSSNLLSLGELAEGEVGVSHVVLDGPGGDKFAADFQAKYGIVPVYRDSIYYDNAMTMLTALFTAMQGVDNNPDALDGAMVRRVMPCSSIGSARLIPATCTPVPPATICAARPDLDCPAGDNITAYGPGVEGIRTAIRAIQANQPIEYTGASGPVDYDIAGNVKNKVANYTVQNGRYVDLAQFDCVASNLCVCQPGSGVGECPVPQ